MITRVLRLLHTTLLLAMGSVLLVASACGGSDSPTEPTVNVPYSQTDLVVGTGTEATAGTRANVAYSGWLYDASRPENKGALFESGTYSFILGLGTVIPGWEQGVPGMRVGGQRRLVIPPALAYGSRGSGAIPPNATIIFDISLLSVQ